MSTTTDSATFVADWQAWHESRETYFRDPHGWVAITALHWLTADAVTLDGVPGRWSAPVGGVARIEAQDADGLTLPDGTVIDGFAELDPVEGGPGLRLRSGDLELEVARRTGNVIVRVHDPLAPQLAAFGGIPAYEPSERWVVQGVLDRFSSPRDVVTGGVVDGLEHHHTAVGVVRFSVDGIDQALTVFDHGARGYGVLFRDATSGVTTYPASRTLTLGPVAADGTVTLDFNRASNLPCGLTQFATCPVPPPENVLTVSVEAGEQWVR